jgi:rubrerythrin
MNELTVTASAIISFSEALEDSSSAFYEELAERFAESKETFLAFAKESKKNKTLVVRTYQETITDALEACFSFQGLDLGSYAVATAVAKESGYTEALELAIRIEEQACEFYLDIAERSQSLLATIPGAFRRVAKKRSKRKLRLQLLLDEALASS